jgi:tetratricopeptide (TPR) repeat protein
MAPHFVRTLLRLVALGALFTISTATQCVAQELEAERALKYHELLVARPEPGYLFDRFYNTWLDESTVDSLEQFLSTRARETRETPDQLLLAFFFVKKGDDVAALEEFQKALAANPASAATWYDKALDEARTLDFDSAIADLKKGREQSPDEKLAVQIDKQLGKLLVRNRKTAEALQVWNALIKAHPNDDELCEDLIDLHIDEGLFKEASQLTETLIAGTKDPYLLVMRRLRLGDIRNRAGNREQAIAEYTLALDDVGNESWLEREILAQMEQVYPREDDIAGSRDSTKAW